jgi:hypothetical protein
MACVPESPLEACIPKRQNSGVYPLETVSADSSAAPPRRRFYHLDKSRAAFDPACFERFWLFFVIAVWFLIGVFAIVTTKILLTDWNVPPLLLTFQQLAVSSSFLRLVMALRPGGVQPLPWERCEGEDPSAKKLGSIWENHSDFLLAGLFNGLDFLASNTAFSRSAASFVETIKSSDPITTTVVALAWNVDRVASTEAVALSILIVGVLLSTWANSQLSSSPKNGDTTPEIHSLEDSISGASIVIIANFCFAFRAMFQKRYQAAAGDMQMDDINLLCRMQQTGAAALLLPVIVACTGFIFRAYDSLPHSAKMYYVGLSAANAFFYAVYK